MRWEVFIKKDGISFFHLEFAIGGMRPNNFVLRFIWSSFGDWDVEDGLSLFFVVKGCDEWYIPSVNGRFYEGCNLGRRV